MKRRPLAVEECEDRFLMAVSPVGCCFVEPPVASVDPMPASMQYRIHQSPRIQLGNAPLVGTPAFDGFDQIDILWQTVGENPAGADRFVISLRESGAQDGGWQIAERIDELETGVDDRIIHSVTFTGLQWNRLYEYQVQHFRDDELVDEYRATFKTRLEPGDRTEFTFAAYGDSASLDTDGFGEVQHRINESDADFSLLLGDNIYPSGSHHQADARFDPNVNPEAADWIASHVDYFAMGNHDIQTDNGQPTLDSFSMPIPEAGVNAFAAAPDGEDMEAYGSFDYGDVHFVTFDSNSIEMSRGEARDVQLQRQAEFLFANLQASHARWKVVYMHHPLVGSKKFEFFFDTNYMEIVGQKLIDAGVDLVLVGDSHSYAWTYPMRELNDANANGDLEPDEIEIVNQSTTEFQKGDGLVQLIAGVGGHQTRDDVSIPRPFFAQVHSENAQSYPASHGFARIHVSPRALTVQYISGEDGHIVGDLNKNGTRDSEENYFAEFAILDNDLDLNQDGSVNVFDLDELCRALDTHDSDPRFDVDQDGQFGPSDAQFLLTELDLIPGDANLDGRVDSQDLVLVFQAGYYESDEGTVVGWQAGDWNCDGAFSSADLVLLFQGGVYQP